MARAFRRSGSMPRSARARRRRVVVGRPRSRSYRPTIRTPTQVGGGARDAWSTFCAVSTLASLARRYGFDALIAARRARERPRGRRPARRGARADHDALARRAGGRARRAAAARAPPLPVRRARGGLAAGRRALVRRRAARRRSPRAPFVAGMAAAFLLGNLRDDIAGARRPGDRARRRGDRRLQQPRPRARASSSSLPSCSGSAGSPASPCASAPQQAEAAELRASQAEREREAAARIAVAEERARIARELHDIVAHAVSVMVLQVGAVRHRLPDGARAGQATRSRASSRPAARRWPRCAACSARCASDGEDVELAPAAGPRRPRLAARGDRARRPAGARCRSRASRFPLPPAIDLSAYRIVQEGLTNALKHARAGQADVVVRYAPGELQIEVRDDGARQRDRRRPRPRPRRHPRARQDLRRRDERGHRERRRLRAQHAPPARRDARREHPRPRRRRPVDGARRLPHAALRRGGHRGRRRGEQRRSRRSPRRRASSRPSC